MKQTDPATVQTNIAAEMHVSAGFDANEEIERRISFLANYLRSNGLKTYVLGISGGVDSSTAGRLAQLAVERLRARHVDARFIAMRLPYGEQRDEADAQRALAFIQPDETLTVNVKPAADAMRDALNKVEINEPAVPLVANVLALAISSPVEIRNRLIEQVTGMVRWRESMMYLQAQGVTNVYEVGAGKVLSGIARRFDGLQAANVGTPEELEAASTALAG